MSRSDPGTGSRSVTPSDDANLTTIARALYITGAGDVRFLGEDNEEDTWTVPANFVMPIMVRKVFATGTTATDIKALI